MHLQIIVGSVRKGRTSLRIAEWFRALAARHRDFSVELVDLKTWDLPMFDLAKPPAMGAYEDARQKEWAEKVAQGDAYVFVCPEYNHGYPAALKNAVDYLFAEWHRKPAAFVSFGNAEGARAVEQLRLVLIELQMAPLATALHIRDLGKKLDDSAFVGDDQDAKRATAVLDDLSWWAAALGAARTRSAV